MFRRLALKAYDVDIGKDSGAGLAQTLASYLGMLGHANTFEVSRLIQNSHLRS
jgi:hypothetical protein